MSDSIKVIFICILIIYGCYSCDRYTNSPEYLSEHAREIKACETPSLVSSVNGVNLYVVRPDCGEDIYFSATGASWKVCHGKHGRYCYMKRTTVAP